MYCSCEGQKNLSAKWIDYTIAICFFRSFFGHLDMVWYRSWDPSGFSGASGLHILTLMACQGKLVNASNHIFFTNTNLRTAPGAQWPNHDQWDVVLSVQPLKGFVSSNMWRGSGFGSTVGDRIQIRLIGWVIVVRQSGSTMGHHFWKVPVVGLGAWPSCWSIAGPAKGNSSNGHLAGGFINRFSYH